ncbi:MAG TPA: M20 family metallopeptidase [Acidimicrobiales bacterium]|nr:M20 family metallopeptidase [Acidimicrobiales bacterium]
MPPVPLADAAAAQADRMTDLRRALHARPELSFAESATTAVITDEVAAAGLRLLPCPTPTGAVALLEGGRPGRTVVLRADIDALPVQEETGLAYASAVDGVMHACGHDAHTAILLGVAAAMARCADDLPGRYLFVWQPGEEQVDGARRMLDGGLFDTVRPDAAIGLHVASVLPVGMVATRAGVAMAGCNGIRLVVTGGGGHGALNPRQGNVVLAAARLADRLDSVVAGLGTDGAACVCSPGAFHAGTAANVVPSSAVVGATLRWFEPAQRDEALGRLRALADEVAAEFAVEVAIDAPDGTGPVRNDPTVTDLVLAAAADALPRATLLRSPSPVAASDDVSELLDRVPGCYLMVGAAPAGGAGPHHSPTFAVDDAALPVGATLLAAGAAALAAR